MHVYFGRSTFVAFVFMLIQLKCVLKRDVFIIIVIVVVILAAVGLTDTLNENGELISKHQDKSTLL